MGGGEEGAARLASPHENILLSVLRLRQGHQLHAERRGRGNYEQSILALEAAVLGDGDTGPERVALELLVVVVQQKRVLRAVAGEVLPHERQLFQEERFVAGDDTPARPEVGARLLIPHKKKKIFAVGSKERI